MNLGYQKKMIYLLQREEQLEFHTYIKERIGFYFADGNLTWIKDFDSNLYSKFLYYWFQSYEGRKKFEALAKGTAQKAVPISGIKTLEIELPSLKSQKRIADILSAYD